MAWLGIGDISSVDGFSETTVNERVWFIIFSYKTNKKNIIISGYKQKKRKIILVENLKSISSGLLQLALKFFALSF